MNAATSSKCARKLLLSALFIALGYSVSPHAIGALTEISDAPMSSASAQQVPPNILFVLDDSGSMAWDFMPEAADNYSGRIGGYSHLCNTLYYKPSTKYSPPLKADGSSYADSDFDDALNNGYDSGDGDTDLDKFRSSGGKNPTWDSAFYYKWNGAQDPTNGECGTSLQMGAHTTGNWEKVFITDAADKTNFANWYSYYRTRILLMKTAAGRAFSVLNQHYRVGFLTINPGSPVKSSKYLKIDNFDDAHKSAWYNILYKQDPNGSTPLREALSRAGRHFAGVTTGINDGMSDDPLQYSCQPNFTILTTDGSWNSNGGIRINGTAMGDQDSDLATTPRPMYDGGPVTKRETYTYIEWRYQNRNGSPNCPSGQRRATKETRTVTVNTDTPQYGNQNTSTTRSSIQSQSICLPSSTSNTNWAIESGSENTETTSIMTGSASNTLADVAEYYYRTDLRADNATRTGPSGETIDIGTDNVPGSGSGVEDDTATHQHMTTFTVGLGVSGQLEFDPNYKSATTGDFHDIRTGTKGWPKPGSTDSDPAKTDDLWHAAVNGRGQAFSAKDPNTLANSLQTALSNIQARVASSAAAATSNLEPTEADRLVFLPKYVSAKWTGEIEAHLINLTDGSVEEDMQWSAQERLDAKTKAACDDRRILLYRAGAADNLVNFSWNSKACDDGTVTTGLNDAEKAYFNSPYINGLSQWLTMTDGTGGTVDQKSAAEGANLVNFIRGQRGNEDYTSNVANKLYRSREHVLGDIVGAQPVYVAAPDFGYSDVGYAAFKTAQTNRARMVYAAANDGMLHAFAVGTAPAFTDGGNEAWAFIPSAVLPKLYKLADSSWQNQHEYTVDGSPIVGDVYDTSTSSWKTILVGGLNKGGKGYYALDITNPASPKALWEFGHNSTCYDSATPATHYADCHIGYSFGNPVVTKLVDGSWVVLVTSGYNNVNTPPQAGDGHGYLYILDAVTGKIRRKIDTNRGDATTPSGLAKINNWVFGDPYLDAKTSRVYAGDLLGNVFVFDVNAASPSATLIATAKDAAGNPQPITTKPELAEVGSPPAPYVYVATGKYLASPDVSSTQVQSLYAIKDPQSATAYANLRDSLLRLTMTNVNENNERFVTCAANCTSQNGWMVDFPDSGERTNIDMKLQLGTLTVLTNVPKNSTCEPGGYSYKNYFDYASGQSPLGIGKSVGGKLSGSLAVGFNIIRLPSGKVIVISTDAAGNTTAHEAPIGSGAPTGKRVSWREILN